MYVICHPIRLENDSILQHLTGELSPMSLGWRSIQFHVFGYAFGPAMAERASSPKPPYDPYGKNVALGT